jgi:hypothetical protein
VNIVNWVQLALDCDNPGLSGTCPAGTDMQQELIPGEGWRCCCDAYQCQATTTSAETTTTTEGGSTTTAEGGSPTTADGGTTTTVQATTTEVPNQCPPCIFSGTLVNWLQLVADCENPGVNGACPDGTEMQQDIVLGEWKCCCDASPCVATTTTTEEPTTTTTEITTTSDPLICPDCVFNGLLFNWLAMLFDWSGNPNPGLKGYCLYNVKPITEWDVFNGWQCCCDYI